MVFRTTCISFHIVVGPIHPKKGDKEEMKKNLIILCVSIASVLLLTGSSFAASFGVYLEHGGGSGEAEYDFAGSDDFDIDTKLLGIGFQMESSPVNSQKAFSYRFQVGFESRDIEDEEDITLELEGLVFNNTFAFGGNVAENIRFWVGPQIMVGFYSGETDEEYGTWGYSDEISFKGASFGLGLAGGANFAFGGTTVLTTTVGIRTMGFAGSAEWYDEDDDLTGNAKEVFFSVGIMF